MIYQAMRKVMPARGFKGVAMAYAATKIVERVVRKNRTLRRTMSVVNTASWAVPLGLYAWRQWGPGSHRPEPAAGD